MWEASCTVIKEMSLNKTHNDVITSLALQLRVMWCMACCRVRVGKRKLHRMPTVELQRQVGGAVRVRHLQCVSFCFSCGDLLSYSLYNRHHHGSRRGVAEPHRQETTAHHETQRKPGTGEMSLFAAATPPITRLFNINGKLFQQKAWT